jgi:hypothetical protein
MTVALGAISIAVLYVVLGYRGIAPASANQPDASLEYTLHVGGCSTIADYKGNCSVTEGSTFVASVSLDAIPGPYDAVGVTVAYTGVTSKNNPEIVWPDCLVSAPSPPIPGYETAGCGIQIQTPNSSYLGTVFTASFNCLADGTLSLVHGPADTLLIGDNGKTSTEAGPDVLNIDCAPPTVTPTPTQTATPTPQPVGGVSLDASNSNDSAIPLVAATGALLSVVLGYGLWRVRTRRAG